MIDQCNWYKDCANVGYDCEEHNNCVQIPQGNVFHKQHNIATDYTIAVGGVLIPVVRTTRCLTMDTKSEFSVPDIVGYYFADTNMYPIECSERTADYFFSVTEDCTIEKSVICFIDQRYGICLYRYQKDEIHLVVTSNETALIKEPWGVSTYFQAQIKTNSYTATRTVEWRLIVNGVEEVLKSTVTGLEPFGPRNNGLPSGTGLFPNYAPDPETRMVLLFPTPPSMGIPWSEVICRLGCYEFGYDTPEGAESAQNRLDGGNKDHYYPEWCRNLQEDPFWRKAAYNRYMIDWFHSDLTDDNSYIPPAVTTDPLPLGSYAKHPHVGEAYQFLVDGDTVVTSPDFNALIDSALPDDNKTHGTTLYYPIGVI